MFELVIKGFNNKEEAEMFLSWYSGQGEHNAAYWFEEVARTEPVRDFISVDHQNELTGKWNDNQLTMVVK